MTFDDILAQVLVLLQREGRVSYRALKLRFDINDDYIEGLKDELIYAKKLAVDEENRVLVWTGNIEGTIDTLAPPPQAIPAPLTQATALVQPPSPLGTSRTLDAERRQLTLIFCDLVDSTRLSNQLDPEEYREVVRAYQRVCSEVIQRYDGYIAQLLGDGLLVYFGYPQAHEDDAQRAIRAGLGMLAAMGDLNQGLQQAKGIQLAIRIGIHTGLVVVGAMGAAGRQEQLALGEVPNIASRIEGLAAPNTVAMSEATYRLVQGYFQYQDLGAQALRGVTESMRVYQVLRESGATSRLDIAQPRGLTPLVGRESEVTLLLERWEQAKSGQGQVVLLTGDAGIGKSRLVQMLKDHVASEPHMRWECRSSEYYQNTALYPLTDFFQRALHWQQSDTAEARLEKLEQELRRYRLPLAETIPMFAPLLSLPIPDDRYPPLNLSPQRQRQKTLESIGAMLLELAEQQPVLFILEDLHWTDPTTLEFLGLLVEQVPTAAIATLLSCRPHFQPSWHHRSYLTEITVNRLSHAQVEQIVTGMTDGKTFPAAVLQQIIAKTDGVPLFVEEITKAILESGQLKALDGHYELVGSLSTFAIPATLQDSLMARLDRLVTAKAVAQYAAVIGRQFAYDLLSTVSQLDEATLQRELGRLVEAEIVYQRGVPPQATYVFKHALIQDAAYQSLLRSTRQGYHRRIAEVLVEQFPETAETQPELLAQHFTEADLIERAIDYWQQAGEKAMQRSAHVEAIIHLDKGLALLKTLPETPERIEKELVLLTTLGPALIVIKGQASPEVATIYGQAWELCRRVGETPQHFSAFFGLWLFYTVRAELRTARELGEQLLTLAHGQSDITLLPQACRALGAVLFLLGEPLSAQQYVEQGINCYNAQSYGSLVFRYDVDPGVACLAWSTLTHWLLGYPDQALERMQQALSLARQLGHPYSRAFALSYALVLYQYRQEAPTVLPLAEESIVLCAKQGFPTWEAWGKVLRGWGMAVQGEGEQGSTQIHQGLTAWRATGAETLHAYFLGLLADAYRKVGQCREGVHAVDEALVVVDRMEERSYEAELYRLKGALLLQLSSDNQAEAETCFQQAMAIAQNQQVKSFELRAATSLARLWQQQGKRQEAHDLLAPVYGWFTEGFDTADLLDAKALLDELG